MDKAAVTPGAGLEDLYFGVASGVRDVDIALVYHLRRAGGNGRYGDEWDFSVGRRFAGRYDSPLKFAAYEADGFSTDTSKAWLLVSAGF